MSYLASEERGRVAAEALSVLGGQIRHYCGSYPERIAGLRGRDRQAAERRFLANARTLVVTLDKLLAMAREIRSLATLNFEQIEAAAESARDNLRRAERRIASGN